MARAGRQTAPPASQGQASKQAWPRTWLPAPHFRPAADLPPPPSAPSRRAPCQIPSRPVTPAGTAPTLATDLPPPHNTGGGTGRGQCIHHTQCNVMKENVFFRQKRQLGFCFCCLCCCRWHLHPSTCRLLPPPTHGTPRPLFCADTPALPERGRHPRAVLGCACSHLFMLLPRHCCFRPLLLSEPLLGLRGAGAQGFRV